MHGELEALAWRLAGGGRLQLRLARVLAVVRVLDHLADRERLARARAREHVLLAPVQDHDARRAHALTALVPLERLDARPARVALHAKLLAGDHVLVAQLAHERRACTIDSSGSEQSTCNCLLPTKLLPQPD